MPLLEPLAIADPARLGALRRTGLLDTPASDAFDRYTRLAARIFNVPTSTVALVDDRRVVMPEMGGGALARHVARLRPGTPVLFASGYPNGHLLDGGALPAGAALLDKPLTPQPLVARVGEMLQEQLT